jgi:hypothetical protein
MILVKIRNLLISAGAYYLARWVAFPLVIAYGKFTNHIITHGDFSTVFVRSIVLHVPEALGATLAGASVAWLVESDQPQWWAIFPALLYAFLGYLGWHWSRPPVLIDRVTQVVAALFPAVMCLLGGFVAGRRRSAKPSSSAAPGI